MSVRGYKVLEIKTNERESFNLWFDDIIDFLNVSDQLNIDGCGLISVSVLKIKKVLAEENLNSEIKKCLKEDINGLNEFDYIQYYCY